MLIVDRYCMINGALYYCMPIKDNQSGNPVLCVPYEYRESIILAACHQPALMGHFGTYKTLQKVKYSYYWPRMASDCEAYIKGCQICMMANKPRNVKAELVPVEIPRGQFESTLLDVLALPTSSNKFKYILVIIDLYSRFIKIPGRLLLRLLLKPISCVLE